MLEEYHANFDSCSLFCGCKIEMMIKPITADGLGKQILTDI